VPLQGWLYDIHSFDEVVPVLMTSGRRVIVPYLRRHGTTRLLSGATFRNGRQAAVARDAVGQHRVPSNPAVAGSVVVDRDAVSTGAPWFSALEAGRPAVAGLRCVQVRLDDAGRRARYVSKE
jgi:hypothetical protein